MFGKKKKEEEELKKQGAAGGVKKEKQVIDDEDEGKEGEEEEEIEVQQLQQPSPQQQQQPPQMRYFAITPDLILKNQISSIGQLAEPYILIQSKRQNAGAIVHAANILARHPKGYRIHSFTMSRFYAYMIMEKDEEE